MKRPGRVLLILLEGALLVMGTGGVGHYPFGEPLPLSERRNTGTSEVLALTLKPQGYDWEFIPITPPTAQPFTDRGSGACH